MASVLGTGKKTPLVLPAAATALYFRDSKCVFSWYDLDATVIEKLSTYDK